MEDSAQKAKFYDLIIDRAKKELDGCSSLTCDTASLIFKLIPELNIDEGEMMRKEIIQFLQLPHPQFVGKRDHEKWIAWLEKQGKQSLPTTDERVWLHLVSDVLTWENGDRQFLDNPKVQELAKKLCYEYAQKLYNSPSSSSAYDVCEVKGPDYEGFTDFEKALTSACIGWMGKKPNWQHYIKESASILLETATKTSDLIQDAPFEEEHVNKFKPMYTIGDHIIPLNDELCEVVGICIPLPDRAIYSLKRMSDICGEIFEVDAHTIDSTATPVHRI